MMITDTELLSRLLLALVLGACAGFERERRGQAAGLRTHMILSVGAALAMILSISNAHSGSDPNRLAAQVVSGIGFLGAGAIIRSGAGIRGLTTATSLWTTAIIGLAAGAGQIAASIGAACLLLFILTLVNRLERRYVHGPLALNVQVTAADRPGLVAELRAAVTTGDTRIDLTGLQRDCGERTLQLTFLVTASSINEDFGQLADRIALVDGVRTVEIGKDLKDPAKV